MARWISKIQGTRVLTEKQCDRRPELYSALLTDTYLWNPLDFFSLYGHRPLPPGKQSKVAVAQMKISNDKKVNYKMINEEVVKAKNKDAELIVFPEFALSGFYENQTSAEVIPGGGTEYLMRLAMKYKIYLIAGLIEEDHGLLYNTAVLTGPEGYIGKYRKIHLNQSDKQWATCGNEWKTFDLPIGRIGLLIGYDAFMPEAGRILSLQGCDLIACPSAIPHLMTMSHRGTSVKQNYPIPTSTDPYHWHLFRVRAGENNVYVAFSNIYLPEKAYLGKSGIFGPDTFSFPRSESMMFDDEGVILSKMDTRNLNSGYPTNVVRRKDLVMMRQPHYYKDLIRFNDLKSGTNR